MPTSPWKARLSLVACTALVAGLGSGTMAGPAVAAPDGSGVVISEAYLSGGSANAVYKNKFVELHNPTASAISLEGWSLQYRSAGGTGAANTTVPLSGSIAAGGYFLVGGGSNGPNGAELPAPDLATGFSPSGTNGTVILSDQAATLTLPVGPVAGNEDVVDLLGYGNSNTFETRAATPPAGNSDPKSLARTGSIDTDSNYADFTLDPVPSPTGTGNAGGDPEPVEPEAATIAQIQGDGAETPLKDRLVTTSGIVTAAFPTGGIDGYYLQTPGTGGDAAAAASSGIFIHSPATVGDVRVGEHLRVTGTADEQFGLTQINVPAGGAAALAEPAEAVKPLTIAWPATDAEREKSEGMLWDPQGEWTLADNYSLNGFGELRLAYGASSVVPGQKTLPQPTDVVRPGSAAAAAIDRENAARSVTLDDGSTVNYLGADANKDIPLPYLTLAAPIRVGAPVDFLGNVVLDYRYDRWRFQPLTRLTGDNPSDQPAAFGNTRTSAPQAVGGNVRLASFNVLNYFTTTGDQLQGCRYYEDRDGNPVTVRSGCDARGAADAGDLERQQAKIVSAINGLDADVVSLEEIENSAAFGKDRDAALATLTSALNAATAGQGAPKGNSGRTHAVWDYVRSPDAVPAEEDVIRTAFIYRKAAVRALDESVILDDPAFSNARQPLAQTFMKVGGNSATRFVAIVNHFKSKGSDPADGSGNADSGDGQGAWNEARVGQARALVAFADRMKDRGNTEKVFLTGDFNSYTQEDPMQVLHAAGYIDQGAKTGEQTYLFDGLVGSLDHILASPAADAAVTGQAIWNINADEPIALEYSRFNYNATNFYAPDPYRASDHDPLVVGVQLDKK